jgi:transposase InsO family protein
LAALRKRHPHWGAKKLRHLLARQHPRTGKLPGLRTLERWLHDAGVTVPRPPRARRGPQLPRPLLTKAAGANEVWTIDFKGWFVLGDGQRCEPLTVRDLGTRFVLAIVPVTTTSDRCVRAALRPVFARWGLPAVIRVDNGSPFGGLHGPLNLSCLSVWWQRLGIQVEFIRPAKPQDNGAHEQMHRILKAETLAPPAGNQRAQQRRFQRWQREYNYVRPHEALGGRCPAEFYRRSLRPWQTPLPLHYPAAWLTRRVLGKGAIRFLGRTRNIGRAFAGETIGLQPRDPQHYEVYLGTLHLGTLHLADPGAMRPCVFRTPPPRARHTKCKPTSGGKV